MHFSNFKAIITHFELFNTKRMLYSIHQHCLVQRRCFEQNFLTLTF